MNDYLSTIQNTALAKTLRGAPQVVVRAIKDASVSTGVDFGYLVNQAKAESSFRPDVKAKTSSATGLYQFIERTWLDVVERHGSRFGIEAEGKSRDEILNMRKDPQAASFMAAALAEDNQRVLEQNWAKGQKDIGSTELYLAHFLGAGQASAFLKAKDEDGLQDAALLFPAAAKANQNVFFEPQTQKPRSIDDVYAFFDKKFNDNSIGTREVQPMKRETPKSPVFMAQHPALQNPVRSTAKMTQSFTRDLLVTPVEVLLLTQTLDLPFADDAKDNI